jgi:iron complex transport system ATP-binding protein
MTAGAEREQTIVEFVDFSFRVDEKVILKDISFSAARSDFISIIGPNGAGKSTLLKCLMRLQARGRKSGRILIKNADIAGYGQRQLARVISFVPQAGGWIPPFTVRDFARLSRFPHVSAVSGLSRRDEEAVDRALALTGLTDMARRTLKTMSGGERQKAFLAAALAQEAEVMLLDEPAAALDPKHASELIILLDKLNQEEKLTILTVTHDLNHPLKVGGKTMVLAEGRCRYFGPSTGLINGGVLEQAFDHPFLYLDRPGGQGRLVVAQ